MITEYNKLLNAYMCYKTSKSFEGKKSLLACKPTRLEAIVAGLQRLPFKRV